MSKVHSHYPMAIIGAALDSHNHIVLDYIEKREDNGGEGEDVY